MREKPSQGDSSVFLGFFFHSFIQLVFSALQLESWSDFSFPCDKEFQFNVKKVKLILQ